MGRTHARHAEAGGRARVVGVCGRSREAAERMISEAGLAHAAAFGDFQRMLDEVRPEVLVAAVPPGVHAGEVEEAAARGIHLFLEKPVARTVERAAAQVEAIERAGVVGQVGYHFRFKDAVRRFAREEAGPGTLFQGRFWCRFDGPAWWRDGRMSGGQMAEQAIHLLDLACHFLGEPVSVCGHLANLEHGGEADYSVEDTGVALIRFRSGALATVSCSNAAVRGRFVGDFRLVFRDGVLDYESSGDGRVADRARLQHQGREEEWVEEGNPYRAEMEAFLDAVEQGRPSPVPARVGLETLRLALAVGESSRQGGRPVDLNGGGR